MKKLKTLCLCYAAAGTCFLAVAILEMLFGQNRSLAVIFLCLAAMNMCLGSVRYNQYKKAEAEAEQQASDERGNEDA